MSFIIAWAIRRGMSARAAQLFAWIAPLLALIAVILLVVALIYHKGTVAGGAKVEAKAERAHAKTIAEAKADGEKAQAVTDAIGKHVTRADDMTTDLVRSKIKDINDAIDTPPPPAGAPPAVFPADRVSASLNDIAGAANRAAATADAERGGDQDGAGRAP